MLLAAIQLVVGCTTSDEPSSARGPGALIAYVIPDNAPWWNAGQAGFTLLDGTSRLATWTKKRPKPSFGGMSSPLFTADGRYAVVMYNDEGGAGRLPYDGYDIHAVLVVVDTETHRVREVQIPARSRSQTQTPMRPGQPYALQGSTIIWAGPDTSDAPDPAENQVSVMQLDLSKPDPKPSLWRTVELPARTAPKDWLESGGLVVGAGNGAVVIARNYGRSATAAVNRLFLTESDGTVRELGDQPWPIMTAFSPDGTRFAALSGERATSWGCEKRQITVYDPHSGETATGFPAAPFTATPSPYFYGNRDGALWWTPDGRLRAMGSAERCPEASKPTDDVGVWELHESTWERVGSPGDYRGYPLPGGGEAVVARVARPNPKPDESDTKSSLFLRIGGHEVTIADAEPGGVAVRSGTGGRGD